MSDKANEVDSAEIEINLEKVHSDAVENETETEAKDDGANSSSLVNKSRGSTFELVEPKHISNLTDDERATIIASARNGFEQPYYDVKFYKNGNNRIVRRKMKQPTTAQQIINSQPLPTPTESKRYYTDNQLLFEHIIELNSKVEKLTAKHKKLKKKYNSIRNDIYADEDDIEPSPLIRFEEDTTHEDTTNSPVQSEIHESTTDEHTNNYTSNNSLAQTQQLPIPKTRSNWRSQVKYL